MYSPIEKRWNDSRKGLILSHYQIFSSRWNRVFIPVFSAKQNMSSDWLANQKGTKSSNSRFNSRNWVFKSHAKFSLHELCDDIFQWKISVSNKQYTQFLVATASWKTVRFWMFTNEVRKLRLLRRVTCTWHVAAV